MPPVGDRVVPRGADLSGAPVSPARTGFISAYRNAAQKCAARNLVRRAGRLRGCTRVSNLTTSYTYTAVNQLQQVSMVRDGHLAQTRTFGWTRTDGTLGPDLLTSTNPENGTVTYTYDGAHHVATRIDAKNQKTQYNYDQYGRLSSVQHFLWYGSWVEDTGQHVDYYYDTNPFNGTYSQNVQGRLAAVQFRRTRLHGLFNGRRLPVRFSTCTATTRRGG